MEVSQWVDTVSGGDAYNECLNPYFDGSISVRQWQLNSLKLNNMVLILILMEVSQWVNIKCFGTKSSVLILILMEVSQWDIVINNIGGIVYGLNPYFDGSISVRVEHTPEELKAAVS